ncbi:MAG: hypothetical protein ACMG51_07255 [Ginsengibacter sp.]
MKDNFYKKLVPENEGGKANNLEESVKCKSEEGCIMLFKKACDRMLNINSWHHFTDEKGASFCVVDEEENVVSRTPRAGDYVRIDVPGPDNKDGGGYDWVKIDTLKSDAHHMGMTFRACERPQKNNHTTNHFFNENATSTFIIQRTTAEVIASYHGRNEKINTDDNTLADNIRNVIVGIGALLGFSELQWKALIKSFLDK